MTCFETKGTVVLIFFLNVHCPVFQQGDKNMLIMANVQEASFLHDYVISFDIPVSLPAFVLFLIAFLSLFLILSTSEVPKGGRSNLISHASILL
jgi:hypothetical protein